MLSRSDLPHARHVGDAVVLLLLVLVALSTRLVVHYADSVAPSSFLFSLTMYAVELSGLVAAVAICLTAVLIGERVVVAAYRDLISDVRKKE